MKTYSGQINSLNPNQVFCFGSNRRGAHGAGAALYARLNFGAVYGAVYGQAKGLQGQSYGIITKDLSCNVHPSVSSSEIEAQVKELYRFARANPDKEFLIAYSGVGRNLNGYTNQEMAFLFDCEIIPENVVFEEKFAGLILNHLNENNPYWFKK